MFNHMCSVRSSEMNFDEPGCKEENDDESGALGLFHNKLWKDSDLGSSKRNYGVNIFQNTSDKSDDLMSKDCNL